MARARSLASVPEPTPRLGVPPLGPHYASRSEAETLASTMSDEHLACREMSHRWVSWAASWSAHENRYKRTLRCDRCLTEKVQYLDSSGAILSGSYNYADGYSTPGTGRIVGEARDALRLAGITRSIAGEGVRTERLGPKRRARKAVA